MPLFSALAKQGVCIINEKLNLCMPCAIAVKESCQYHLHCLLQLDDNKSAASCQQTGCKLIVQTFYPQAYCFNNLQQLSYCSSTYLIFTDLMQLGKTSRLDASW